MEDPKSAKGVVKREIVRVITPGTQLDAAALAYDQASFVVALCPGNTDTPGLRGSKPLVDPATFADPADVAREALDHLLVAGEQGPICIPGDDNRAVRAAFDRMPRKQVVEIIGASTRKMFEG